jgi:hypothetical protein
LDTVASAIPATPPPHQTLQAFVIRRTLPAGLAIVVAIGACDSTEPRIPTALQVDRQTLTLEVGDTTRIEAFVVDQHGRAYDPPPEGHAITWSSSNPGVATVSGGLVRGVSSGAATISASAGALQPAQVPVTVEARTVTMQFGLSYSGHRTGSLSISETVQLTQIDGFGNLALSYYDTGHGSQDIVAQQRRADGTYDLVHIWFDGPQITTTGSRAISAGFMVLGFDLQTETWDAAYLVASGTANFTTAGLRQVAGTFVMSMAEHESGQALSVTGGSFIVPVLTDSDFAAAPDPAGGVARAVQAPQRLQHRGAPRR